MEALHTADPLRTEALKKPFQMMKVEQMPLEEIEPVTDTVVLTVNAAQAVNYVNAGTTMYVPPGRAPSVNQTIAAAMDIPKGGSMGIAK